MKSISQKIEDFDREMEKLLLTEIKETQLAFGDETNSYLVQFSACS